MSNERHKKITEYQKAERGWKEGQNTKVKNKR